MTDGKEAQTGACHADIHACAAGPVDDDGLPRLIYIVLHAEVGRHPVDQHAVVGRHLWELLKGTEKKEACEPGLGGKTNVSLLCT